MASDKQDPFQQSSDCRRMAQHWRLIRDILEGEPAIKRCREKYLPQYEAESPKSYEFRLKSAPWRPEFRDSVLGISSMPFSKPVTVAGDDVDEKITAFADNVDGSGTNLHRFAEKVFATGISYSMSIILVDYPSVPAGITMAEEKQIGARPYFIMFAPENVLACYFDTVKGKEVITHLRVRECFVEPDGYEEREVERVRIYEPGRFEIWQRDNANTEPVLVDSGPVTLAEVPAVAFFAGDREGHIAVRPPLLDVAYLQLELYRALSRENEVLTYAGSPMLKIVGASTDSLQSEDDGTGRKSPVATTGPKTVITIPRDQSGQVGDAAYIQPDAKNLQAIRDHVVSVQENIRHYALQPTLPKTGDTTATASALTSAKAHSAVQSWAMNLADVLSQALALAARWMGAEPDAVVNINTDFVADFLPANDVQQLITLEASGGISRLTLWDELTRRGTLGPQFDAEVETERLLEQPTALGLMGEHTHDHERDSAPIPEAEGAELGEAA